MYIAPEVIEWVTAVFEYYFSMLGMTDIYIYIFHGVYCVTK